MKAYIVNLMAAAHGGFVSIRQPTVYTKKKSAENAVRRAVKRGIPNRFSGEGTLTIIQGYLEEVEVV